MANTNRERAQLLINAYDHYLENKQAQPLSSSPESSPAPFRVRSLLWLLPLLQA